MDEVTLVGAGLIGVGAAVFGLALAAVVRTRRARARSHSPNRPPGRRPERRPTPPRTESGRPAPVTARPYAAAPTRARPTNDAAIHGFAPPHGPPRRARPLNGPRTNAPRHPVTAPRALDGETLQLGPVPAWRLPVRPRNDAPTHAAAGPDAPTQDAVHPVVPTHAVAGPDAPTQEAVRPAEPARRPPPDPAAGAAAGGPLPRREARSAPGPSAGALVSPAATGHDASTGRADSKFGWFTPGR